MGRFSEDVVRFIEHKFDAEDVRAVYKQLDHPDLTTSRVIRSLLYLSNGSISLLKHYLEERLQQGVDIVLEAEYVSGVTDKPMRARDMSLPFEHPRNLGRCYLQQPRSIPTTAARSPHLALPPRSIGRPRRDVRQHHLHQHHPHLIGRKYYLGEAKYVVCRNQDRADVVHCYRVKGTTLRMVNLPLAFVLDHIAEEIIELEALF